MKDRSFEQWVIDVMSGRPRGVGARLMRAALGVVEPVYAGAAAARNRRFDRSTPIKLGRPTISVGNITTGGTGKTPAVQWIVRALLARGHRPGVLLRGYRKEAGSESDEERLLRESLSVPVVANPDRVQGAAAMLAMNPEINAIVLDDGFQHRQVARDLDIVLIDATNPFGFDHVLPRGLLREPMEGLLRANLIILTRVDQVDASTVRAIEARIFTHNALASLVMSRHRLSHAIDPTGRRVELSELLGKKLFAFSGIGNPAAFEWSLRDVGLHVVGQRRFDDHHRYDSNDLALVHQAATACAADVLVTTEKDWAKLRVLNPGSNETTAAIHRLVLDLSFENGDEAVVLAHVAEALNSESRS